MIVWLVLLLLLHVPVDTAAVATETDWLRRFVWVAS